MRQEAGQIRIDRGRLVGNKAEVTAQNLRISRIDDSTAVQVGVFQITGLATGSALCISQELAIKTVNPAVRIDITGNADLQFVRAGGGLISTAEADNVEALPLNYVERLSSILFNLCRKGDQTDEFWNRRGQVAICLHDDSHKEFTCDRGGDLGVSEAERVEMGGSRR